MVSKSQLTEEQNALKFELIQASLETAIAFAKLALQSDDDREIIRLRQQACEAYEEAHHSLSTAALTHIESESIRTKMAHLESVLMGSGESF